MLLRNTIVIALWSFLLSGTVVYAEKGTELQPTLASPGSMSLDESFSGAEDRHAAVLTLQQPNRNSIIRFSFRLDGATGFNLSFNHAKGHLFRVAVSDSGLTLTKDADKKDPDSKPKALAKASGKFDSAQWHTLLVEIEGDKVSVQSDNGAKLDVREPTFDVEKTGYRFVMRGESLLLDDIKVCNVEP